MMPITLTLILGGTNTNYRVQFTDARGFFAASVGTLPLGVYVYTWRVKGTMFLGTSGTSTLPRA